MVEKNTQITAENKKASSFNIDLTGDKISLAETLMQDAKRYFGSQSVSTSMGFTDTLI